MVNFNSYADNSIVPGDPYPAKLLYPVFLTLPIKESHAVELTINDAHFTQKGCYLRGVFRGEDKPYIDITQLICGDNPVRNITAIGEIEIQKKRPHFKSVYLPSGSKLSVNFADNIRKIAVN